MNRQILLARRPTGLVAPDDFTSVETDVPDLAEGEALMRTSWLSVDATVRTWLDDVTGYLPPVDIGEVVRSSAIGEVVASRCDAYEVGQTVYTLGGWQDYCVVRDDFFTSAVPDGIEPVTAMMSVYGATGATAYFGVLEIGKPTEGDTFVVSAAAGATGSIAGQIARIQGCRVVGICGRDDKCAYLVDDLGFDAAINHRTADLRAELKAACPDKIDVYFDNVGGPILDACLGGLNLGARVVLCGAISTYTTARKAPGPANYVHLMGRRARMEGFNTMDYWDRWPEAVEALEGWVRAGDIRHREHVFDGLERAPEALNAMFTGENIGKTVVRVAG